MCFSAQASFTASAVLALIGTASLLKARHHPRLMPFAAMPFLFAVQQLCEGIIWITNPTNPEGFLHSFATLTYLVFAYFVWPLWIPISFLCAETQHWRKIVCCIASVVGACFVVYRTIKMIHLGFWAHIDGEHISYPSYDSESNLTMASFLYLWATLTPALASHMRYTWLLTAIGSFSLFYTRYWYPEHITSVWCFFAALLSGIVLLIVNVEVNRKTRKKASL